MEQVIKKRIYCFDLLKIISIVLVFFHHIMMDLYIVHPMHNLKILETLIIRPNMNLGMIACGMFIVLSGATLALKGREESPISFYKKRLIRLLIPFYIAYIICFCIRVFNARTIFIYGGIPKWRFIFTLMGIDEYLSANGVATFSLGVGEWFLGAIMFCYVLYPFLYKIHRKCKVATFVVMTIYYIFINYMYGIFHFVIPAHMNCLCQIYNFYIGIVLIDKDVLSKISMIAVNDGGIDDKKSTNNLWTWILFIMMIVVILFFYFYKKIIMLPDNIKTTVVLVALFIVFYMMENMIENTVEKIEVLKKWIIFFNTISLEIYLVHHFIIYQVDYILQYRRISGVETIIVVIGDIAMTIVTAYVVSWMSGEITKRFLKN